MSIARKERRKYHHPSQDERLCEIRPSLFGKLHLSHHTHIQLTKQTWKLNTIACRLLHAAKKTRQNTPLCQQRQNMSCCEAAQTRGRDIRQKLSSDAFGHKRGLFRSCREKSLLHLAQTSANSSHVPASRHARFRFDKTIAQAILGITACPIVLASALIRGRTKHSISIRYVEYDS